MDGQNFPNDQNNQNTQNYTDPYAQNTQNYSDPYGQSNQGNADPYGQNTQNYSDPYGQNNQSNNQGYTDPYTSSNTNNYYQDNTTYGQNTYVQPTDPPKQETPTLAVVSLIMGIASIVLGCCCGIGMIFAIAGIIMSIVAGKTAKSGVGTAGLICSIVGVVFSLGGLAYFIVAIIASAA